MTFVPRTAEELALEWPEDLDHFSASSVKMAVRCPEQWRQRYVQGIIAPPAAALTLGRADHKAVEFSMEQKITSHVDLPATTVKDKFLTVFEEEVEKDGGYSELEVQDPKTKDRVTSIAKKKRVVGEMKRDGSNLVGQYMAQAAPTIFPLAVEKPVELHVGLPVKITGYIDLIAAIGAPGQDPASGAPMQVIDRKRTGRFGVQPEWRLQGDVYQLAEPLPFAWHLSLTSGGGRIAVPDRPDSVLLQPVAPRDRTIKFFEQIIAEIGFLYRKYGPDEPWPTKGKLHPFACNYCGYRAKCWGWSDEARGEAPLHR